MKLKRDQAIGISLPYAGEVEVTTAALRAKVGAPAYDLLIKLYSLRNREGITRATVAEMATLNGHVPHGYENTKKLLRRLEQAGLVQRGPRKALKANLFYRARRVLGYVQRAYELMYVPAATARWMQQAPRAGSGGPRLRRRAAEPVARPQSTRKEVTVQVVEEQTEKSGSLIAVNAPRARRVDYSKLPPMPVASVAPVAKVPNPPKVKPTDPDAHKVKLVADAYRAAIAQTYKKPCWLYKNMTPRARAWGVFLKAANLLAAFDTAPMAWCTFAVRRWYRARTHEASYVKGAEVLMPRLEVILGGKPIEKQLSDEDHRGVVEECAIGGRMVFTGKEMALYKRWRAMEEDARWYMTEEQALAKHFPGVGTYEGLLDEARAAAVDMQLKIKRDIEQGRFVW